MAWWRYSAYEIQQQRICPKPGSRFESYDPWSEYEHGMTKVGESPPYLSLVNLLNEIRPEVSFENSKIQPARDPKRFKHLYIEKPIRGVPVERPLIHAISERARKRVIEWTQHYGLLGVLPQRMLMLQTRSYQSTAPYHRGIYTRTGGDYSWAGEVTLAVEDFCVSFLKATAPFAVIQPAAEVLADFDLETDSQHNWGFVLETETDFWGRYCEPLAEWLAEAEDLSSIIRMLSSKDLWNREMNLPGLNLLLDSTGYHLELGPNGVRRNLFYPSLLAAFAAMFAQDLVGTKKHLTCPECGALAASSSYRRAYCSARCAWRARKRSQRRERAKEA